MFTALWWVFLYRCATYQHLATRTELFCFLLSLHQKWKPPKCLPFLESFPSSSWEHLCHIQSALVFMQQYHYFTSQAPCSLPYLKSFMRIPDKNNRWSPLGSGHETGGIHWVFLIPLFFLLTPPPTQFWCSSLTTVIFVATTVTTSAEEKFEIWWLFLCPNWELKAPLHPHQYALLPGCATMVEMSHTRNALVFDIKRSMNRRLGSSDWTIRQTSEDNYYMSLGHHLQRICLEFTFLLRDQIRYQSLEHQLNLFFLKHEAKFVWRGVATDKQSSTECVYEIL